MVRNSSTRIAIHVANSIIKETTSIGIKNKMIPKIKLIQPLDDFILKVYFIDGKIVLYDVKDDIENLAGYDELKKIAGLWKQVQLDESKTCVFWNDYIDLASDSIYEFGIPVNA